MRMQYQEIDNGRRNLIIASIVVVAAWFIPVIRWLTVPLEYLNTHIHELGHALAAVGTGGAVDKILVHADGSGLTFTSGGLGVLIASAGYLGATIVGAGMLFAARSAAASRAFLRIMATILAIGFVVWLRGDVVGVVTAIAWIGVLWLGAAKLSNSNVLLLTCFIGIQQCMNSLKSLFFLTGISFGSPVHSDATNMQQMTLIPAFLWALGWSAIGIAVLTYALREVWAPAKR